MEKCSIGTEIYDINIPICPDCDSYIITRRLAGDGVTHYHRSCPKCKKCYGCMTQSPDCKWVDFTGHLSQLHKQRLEDQSQD